jgi:predicted transcriptional regulator
MVKKLSDETAINRILKALKEGNLSSREISDKLHLPNATVRTNLSFLKQVNFVKPIPEEKRGKPFMLQTCFPYLGLCTRYPNQASTQRYLQSLHLVKLQQPLANLNAHPTSME